MWAIVFVVLLLVGGGMASVPTSAVPLPRIQSFYTTHRTLLILGQALGIAATLFFLGFAVALGRRERRRGWQPAILFPAGTLVVLCSLATSVPPLWLAASYRPGAGLASSLTRAADLTDTAQFVAVAIFAGALIARLQTRWLQIVSSLAGSLALGRAVISPLGVAALDVIAPLAFLAMVLMLGVEVLRAMPLLKDSPNRTARS